MKWLVMDIIVHEKYNSGIRWNKQRDAELKTPTVC